MKKGVSNNMLKVSSKRRRTRKEIADAKLADTNREAELAAKLAFIAEAEEKLANYDRMAEQNEQANQVISQMQADGFVNIDNNGVISPSKQKPGAEFQDFDNQ